uniref:Nephrocystin-4 n=1 Tax=Meloidogyne javanica TaxID=6303 RepID=A0A915NED0_MELJA
MSADIWHRSGSNPLPLDYSSHSRESLHVLELDGIEFKQFLDGTYFLSLCFYDFRSGCFLGKKLVLDCISTASHINIRKNIIASSSADNESLVIVIELTNRDKNSLGWTVMPLKDVVEQIGPVGLDATSRYKPMLQRLPFFAGSCQLLFLASSFQQLQLNLNRTDGVLSAHKRLCTTQINFPLPLFHFIPQSSVDDESALQKISAILDNILLSFSNANQSGCDSVILDLLSREFYYSMNEKSIQGLSYFRILERRLLIGSHNGLTFLEEPICLLLEPLPFTSQGGSFLHPRSTENLEFGVRQCVRFRSLPVQPELAIVFQLIYLVACPSSKNEDLITNMRLIRIAWAAWSPFVEGRLNSEPADTITLQLVGGPRFSPFQTGSCFRDLSTLPSPSGSDQFAPLPPNRFCIDVHFNFASLSDLGEDNLSTPEPSRTPSNRLIQVRTPPQSDRILKVKDGELSQRYKTTDTSKLPEHNLEVLPMTDHETVEDDASLLKPTKIHPEKPLIVQSQKSENYGAIFSELPLGRISALPRTFIPLLSKFPSITSSGEPTLKAVDVDTQYEKPPDMELEFGQQRWPASEFCLQFLAYCPMNGGFPQAQTPLKLFFTFQFYRFQQFVTESLSTNCTEDNGAPQPLILWRQDASEHKQQPGLSLRFVVDGAQQKYFTTYLLERHLILHVWEADSIFHLGVASIPLKYLLRQGSSGVQCSLQCQVFQSGFSPDLSPSQGPIINGVLFLRLANIGLSTVNAINMKSSLTTIKRVRQLHKSQETPLEHFLALQKIDFAQRASQLFGPKEHQKIHDWNRMKEEKTGKDGDLFLRSVGKSEKFLFAEELAAYRALRRESKAHALLKAVFSSITTKVRVDLTLGQLHLFSFQLRNPLAEEFVCELESNDHRLTPIRSASELNYLQNQHLDIYKIGSFDLINLQPDSASTDSLRLCWQLGLRSMEHVELPMRFDSGFDDIFENANNQCMQGDCRLFVRKLPSGSPLAILELNYTIWRPFLTHHLRFFTEESRKFVRAVPLSNTFGFVRCSDPTVYCQLLQEGRLLRIECQTGEAPTIRDFLIFFYDECFGPIELQAVWRVSIHSFRRLHSETIQGQPVSVPLHFGENDLLSAPGGELIRLYSSSPLHLHFLPGPVFPASQTPIQPTILLNLQQLGPLHLLVNAVRATAQQIISQWLITLSVGRPNVTKTFQVIVPAQVQTVVHKRIPLDNPLAIERKFKLTSSDPTLLYVPTPSPPPIPPNSALPVQLEIRPISSESRPTQRQVLLFVQDSQTGNQEESFQFNIRFH